MAAGRQNEPEPLNASQGRASVNVDWRLVIAGMVLLTAIPTTGVGALLALSPNSSTAGSGELSTRPPYLDQKGYPWPCSWRCRPLGPHDGGPSDGCPEGRCSNVVPEEPCPPNP